MSEAKKSEKDRVIVFDTTLRDGEQCPGATMTFEEKLEVAELLDDMGVDVIEAGFPITSEGDFQAVSEIARRSKNAVIAGLSRAHPADIDRCAEAVKFAKRGRVHTVIATSPLHVCQPSASLVSCFLPAPEGRLGECAWALRGLRKTRQTLQRP